ncbi:putative protein YbiB [Burkholderiales bacterium]|nr:putative protein YbiB [Burkholderiales bacterium]
MQIDCAPLIREIGRGSRRSRDLDGARARDLFGAMLDGDVPDLELGAILIAMRMKGESLPETLGFLDALAPYVARMVPPIDRPRPVVLPSYGGARRGANLTPLLALLLARYGVPVLVHGLAGAGRLDESDADDLDDDAIDAAAGGAPAEARRGRVTSAQVLWELGVAPSPSAAEAGSRLARHGIAYVPVSVLAPGLARLLATRARLGLNSSAHGLAKLLDPFGGNAVRVVSVSSFGELERMREVLAASRADAMLLPGTEGEPYANPGRCPGLELYRNGAAVRCCDADDGPNGAPPALPASSDPQETAEWIEGALAGSQPVPAPILQQLGCLLEASRESRAVAA